MTIHHHLDDATVLRFASGDLDEAFSVVVAAHLAACDTCRRAVRAAEEVGGRLLESVGGVEAALPDFDRLMWRLEEPRPAPAAVAREEGDVPAPLRRFIGPRLDAIRWRTVAPGVRKRAIRLTTPS